MTRSAFNLMVAWNGLPARSAVRLVSAGRCVVDVGKLVVCVAAAVLFVAARCGNAAQPSPVLNNIFPAGGQAGTSVEVTVAGSALTNVSVLRCSHPGITCATENGKQFQLMIPGDVANGHYDLCALTANGLSSVRSFIVGQLPEQSEAKPNDSRNTAEVVPLDTVINGRIEKAGDVDHFAFTAKRGQRIVLECQAERIDSRLRAVIEVFDSAGRRLAVNRGFFGIDPLLKFDVPEDGVYIVRVFDLVYSGSQDHVYRLSIGTGPTVVFSVPAVVQMGSSREVRLFGWNLGDGDAASRDSQYESVVTTIPYPVSDASSSPLRLTPSQIETSGFAYHYPGSQTPIRIGRSDIPVTLEAGNSRSPSDAQSISIPAETSGQLVADDDLDWFRIQAERGEVFWLEAFGERIGSPVDLDVSILDESGSRELAGFSDQLQNVGGARFSTTHSDPSGRWVAPADGAYLVLVRSLIGNGTDDLRRVYRLSIRREEPDFDLALVSRRDDPATMNVPLGGREIADVVAFRRRGMTGSIRVTARDLPPGITCPDVWLGPGVNRTQLVVTASHAAEPFVGKLDLVGHGAAEVVRAVVGSTIVRKGVPTGWSRLTDQIGLCVAGVSPIRITADAHQTRGHDLYGDLQARHAPGTMVDVLVQVDRADIEHQAPVVLRGVGLPGRIQNQKATISAGRSTGYISFYLPPDLSVGHYTMVVQGETTVPTGPVDKTGQRKTESITVFTNPVTIDVQPAAFIVELDQDAPRTIHRGEILQVNYSARRVNGFISKMHTELFAPDGVRGIRGRGVSFVGQTDSGTIQIVANEDAPLGRQPFLRLFAVGVLEDKAVFQGSCLLPLEIVE